MLFRDAVRQHRERVGLTQESLAHAAGLSVGTLRNYEQGIRFPTFPAVVKLAAALGVSCEAFAQCDDVTGPGEEPERSTGKRK